MPDAALMPPDPAYLVASIEISQVIDKQFQQPVLFLICVSSDCVISIYFICAAGCSCFKDLRSKKKKIYTRLITANRPRPGVDFAAQNRRPVGAISQEYSIRPD